jgi:hypothetical protein
VIRLPAWLLTAFAGAVLVIAPVPAEPAWAYAVAGIGLAVVIGSAARQWATARQAPDRRRDGAQRRGAAPAVRRTIARVGRWGDAGTVVAAAAIAQCALSRLGAAALAGEGLLLLGYLLLLEMPSGPLGTSAHWWLRHRWLPMLAGVASTGLVLVALAVTPPAAAWIVLAGVACAVAAYLVAIRVPPATGS